MRTSATHTTGCCRALLLLLFGALATAQALSLSTEEHGATESGQGLPLYVNRGGLPILGSAPAEIGEGVGVKPNRAEAELTIMRRAASSSSSESPPPSRKSSSDSNRSNGSSGSSRSSGGSSGSSESDGSSQESGGSSGSERSKRSKYDPVEYVPDDESTWTLDGSSSVLTFSASAPASTIMSGLPQRHRKLHQGGQDIASSPYFSALATELAAALNIFPEWILFNNIRQEGEDVLYDVQVLLPAGMPQNNIESVRERLEDPASLNLSVPLEVTSPVAVSVIDDTELFPVNGDMATPRTPTPMETTPPGALDPTPDPTLPATPSTTPAPSSAPPPVVWVPPGASPTPGPTQTVSGRNTGGENPPSPPGGNAGLSTGVLIGIIAGVAILIGLSIGLFSYFGYKKKKAATTGTWTANAASEASRGVITPVVGSKATTPREPNITPRNVINYKASAGAPTPRSVDDQPLKQTAVLRPTAAGAIQGEEFEAPMPIMTKSPEYDALKSFAIDREGVIDLRDQYSSSSSSSRHATSSPKAEADITKPSSSRF